MLMSTLCWLKSICHFKFWFLDILRLLRVHHDFTKFLPLPVAINHLLTTSKTYIKITFTDFDFGERLVSSLYKYVKHSKLTQNPLK